ncbi:sensor histidine kinase [Nostoc sp. PCC 7107]|uniref:sensor histidine kinase n=1 Tax=Nostoc sp. PCC 7107 TaxID=317936 RepID=UPI00029F08E0|nr:ATP-binding protein [Nostoc sp. PCC 7107]AFY45440.1 integral membrane sensor signal transduction histidine kinase [Nostoc sp. PCC 7107]
MSHAKKNGVRKVLIWLVKLSNNWSIAQKITYGYIVTVGITCIGTTSGLLLAYNYETYAHKQLLLAYQQQALLKDLENAVTRVRLHPQRLVTVLDNSIWLEFEKNRFLDGISQVQQRLSELDKFAIIYQNNLLINSQDLHNLLSDYEKTTDIYNQLVKDFWKEIEEKNSLSKNNENYQQQILNFLNQEKKSNIPVEFEQLSDELTRLIGHAELQKQHASTSFNNAQKLQVKVILGSVLVSVVIAAILALYTSNLIAHPLKVVTNVARKITQESNFQLKANVSSKDEVGTLASSLNQLVEWVGDYTQELELARQTLEQRVEERTQELELARQTLEHRVEERTQKLQKTLQSLKETQSQLIQTEKMSSLGQMVAGIAHEINNPVSFIYGNIQHANEYVEYLLELIDLYQQQYPEPSYAIAEKIEDIDLTFISKDLSSLLSSMKMGAQRIREIVLSLRNFSRLDEADMKEVDIHEGIDNTLLILNHKITSEITVIKNYHTLPLFDCYPAQINQVFMNIISNAIDALIEQTNNPDKQIIIDTLKLDGNYIKISIKDNAYGIPLDIQHKLFDPFFTTKPVGKGTGLGLSICYQIVEKHQGKIEVISEIDKGTEFAITLPIKKTH